MRVERTFAFADLSGFTNYTAEHGDDAAGRVLGDFRSITRRLASDRGVRVAKWLGDGCMVVSIDRDGVGRLLRIAVEEGRTAKPKLKIGICGEHGGDPQSVGFCHDLGLDYVSCSPYRIPVARLAAAQAVLHERGVEQIIARARANRRAKQPPTYHGTARG